jgi:succinoglycan biosynthesis transport protein ExoP
MADHVVHPFGPAREPLSGDAGDAKRVPSARIVRGPSADTHQPPPGQDYGPSGTADVHLLDYVRILYKRRYIAATAFLIVMGCASVYTFTATPMYQAHVQILIEKEATNVVSFKEAFEQNQTTDDYYQTQYKVLQSRALARRTMDALKLWDDPRFNPKPTNSLTLGTIIRAPIRLIAGWFRTPAPPQAVTVEETALQSGMIDRFLGGLTVAPIRNSRLVDVRYNSADPGLAASISNALAVAYIQQNLEFKFQSSKEASDWLSQQLAEQRKQVDASEQAVQRYREQNNAIALDDRQDIVVQKLAELNSAVTRAKTERIEKEALYRQIHSIQADRTGLDTFPAILSNTFIQQQKAELAGLQRQLAEMSEKLGDRHPDIVKLRSSVQVAESKLQGEIGKVVQSVRNQFLAAQAQENSLTQALNQQKGEALSMNRKGIEYGVLAREAASNRQIFDSLMQRTKETGISGELKNSNIRVVDPAEMPRSPISPNKRNNMLLALLGGFALACGLALFFEYVDNRIKSPEEVRQYLGLPFLGMVPALFDKNIENPLICRAVPNNFSESFRGVRTNLLFASAEDGPRSIVITSTGPGEGKTAIASNLAVALAQSGQRVLLIDADMRKPRVHSVFGKPREPGLSNLLVGNAKSSESVHKTGVPGLWVLPAGALPPNPAELLGSKRFKDFVGSLTQHFDWVMLDTPPVMAVTDASVVAHLATGVLFVIGAEMTSRHAAKTATEQLVHARAKFVGAVLNRVDLQHNPYYYSQYYRREYADYYQTDLRA